MAYIPTTPNRGIKWFPGAEATDQNVLTADVDLLMPCALENQLTAENANERNLITGTRYFNATLMLP